MWRSLQEGEGGNAVNVACMHKILKKQIKNILHFSIKKPTSHTYSHSLPLPPPPGQMLTKLMRKLINLSI